MVFHDPITHDELSFGEWISWKLQGFVRNWGTFIAITAFTVFAWWHGGIFHQHLVDVWNFFASYWAMALETIVGIAMFSQTRRDARILRDIKEATGTLERIEQSVLSQQNDIREGVDDIKQDLGAEMREDAHT